MSVAEGGVKMGEYSASPNCGAPSTRGRGTFCRRPAGEGTKHKGDGHCFRHGGGEGTSNARKHAPLLEAAARGLAKDDLSDLFDMSNKGLILARALAVQRMITPEISTKELADCSMAIQRIDKVLAVHPVDEGEELPDSPLDEEAERLADILSIVK